MNTLEFNDYYMLLSDVDKYIKKNNKFLKVNQKNIQKLKSHLLQ